MRCPLPAALLLLLYFSLPPYISFPRFLPPLPIAPLLLPPPSTSPPLLPPPPAASPPSLPSHLPAPAAAYTARYASSLSLCSPLVPLPLPWLSPPRQGAIYPRSFGDDRARRCALASHLVRCVSCRRARRRQTHVSAHSPTRRFARVRCSKCHRESFSVVAFSSDFSRFFPRSSTSTRKRTTRGVSRRVASRTKTFVLDFAGPRRVNPDDDDECRVCADETEKGTKKGRREKGGWPREEREETTHSRPF